MRLITLMLALFSFSVFGATIDCRERIDGNHYSYLIEMVDGVPQSISINGAVYPARGYYDNASGWVAISTETANEVYEFSYSTNQAPRYHHFTKIFLTTYYGGQREILCRLKN